jgi:cob(I)alamin adenosyltransferase
MESATLEAHVALAVDRVSEGTAREHQAPGRSPGGLPCKHVLAVRLHVARVRAEQAQREVVTAA